MNPSFKNLILIAGSMVATALSTHASVVEYSTDFVGDEYVQNNGNVVFDDGTTTAVEDWFGSTNGVGIADGDLTFSNSTQNRYRGAGVWLDTTGWALGIVTVEVDVSNFVAAAGTSIIFQAYAATGVDASNTVSLDLHGAASIAGSPAATGTATIGLLGAEQEITADGIAVPFTFNYDGTADFVALTFVQINAVGGTMFGSADLDNVRLTTATDLVTAVPNIISIELDESGNVVLTLDGPETGLTVQQSDDLSTGSFVDVTSTPGTNTFTIDSAEVDSNADGTSFYRVRN